MSISLDPLAYAATPVWAACAAFTGAVMASLAGVVAERLPHQLGIAEQVEEGLTISAPSSRCDACRRPLDAISLVPVVGWLVRRGRCPCAAERVSPIYPVIEAAIALLSGAAVAWFGPTWEALALLGILWTCLALAWTDHLHQVLPHAVTVPLFFVGLLWSPFEPDPYGRIVGAALGAGIMWGATMLVGWVRDIEISSGGDYVLLAAAGAWVGAEHIQYFLGATCILYLVEAIPLRRRGIVFVPFGPAVSIAFVATASGIALSGI
jgi:leader peptidase (prepilin peptidase) / N-methyltransferase